MDQPIEQPVGPEGAPPPLTTPQTERTAILYPDDQPKEDKPAMTVGAKSEGEGGEPQAVRFSSHGFDLDVPTGLQMTPQIMAEVAPVFRELNLDSAGANRLMPLASKFAERIYAGQQSEFTTMKSDWARASKNDPELGRNWGETDRLVARAMDAAGAGKGSKLRELLDDSGLGNHPEMIRAFRRLGAKLG